GHLAFERAADQVDLLGFRSARPPLIDNGDSSAQLFLMLEGALDAAFVGTQDNKVLKRNVQVADVLIQDRPGVQVIERDVEEALNLCGVEIEGDDAVGAGTR